MLTIVYAHLHARYIHLLQLEFVALKQQPVSCPLVKANLCATDPSHVPQLSVVNGNVPLHEGCSPAPCLAVLRQYER